MMNHAHGWMNGWAGGGSWLWTVPGLEIVAQLVVLMKKLSKNQARVPPG
jgi:hypothetical protein